MVKLYGVRQHPEYPQLWSSYMERGNITYLFLTNQTITAAMEINSNTPENAIPMIAPTPITSPTSVKNEDQQNKNKDSINIINE